MDARHRLEPREPRRRLEQRRHELPFGEPEQEHAGEPEQQPGLPSRRSSTGGGWMSGPMEPARIASRRGQSRRANPQRPAPPPVDQSRRRAPESNVAGRATDRSPLDKAERRRYTLLDMDTRTPKPATPARRPVPSLENGDHLSAREFLRLYEAMPEVKKAELIQGIVHMASPVRLDLHGKPDADPGLALRLCGLSPGSDARDKRHGPP